MLHDLCPLRDMKPVGSIHDGMFLVSLNICFIEVVIYLLIVCEKAQVELAVLFLSIGPV